MNVICFKLLLNLIFRMEEYTEYSINNNINTQLLLDELQEYNEMNYEINYLQQDISTQLLLQNLEVQIESQINSDEIIHLEDYDNTEYINNITHYIMNNVIQNNNSISNITQKDFINLLKLEPYYKQTKSNDNCSICYDKIQHTEYSRMLKCNHVYHKKCIDKWLYISYKNGNSINCPICRLMINFK